MALKGKFFCRITAVVAAAGVSYFIGLSFHQNEKEISFDAAKWQAAHYSKDKSILFAMSSDLVSRLHKRRASHKQIIKLLGEPDQKNGDNYIRYYLGKRAGTLMSDDCWLSIGFDSDHVSSINVD